MGIFDIKARSWQAPSREEQAHKHELHHLQETEERKRREMKHELETLKQVEHLQHESAQDARHLLSAAAQHDRRRALSGLDDRERLLLAERERMRLAAAHPQAHNSPGHAMIHSPSMSSIGMSVPRLNVPASPTMHSAGLHPGMAIGTPRMRAVSSAGMHHPGLASPALAGMGVPRSPLMGLGAPSPRMRAISSSGTSNAASIERMRLEERKRALMEREARLQNEREHRLLAKKSQLDLDATEAALHRRAQELDARARLDARAHYLDDQESTLNARRREQMHESEMEERLRNLSVNTPSLNPLHASPRLGHNRHLSSPMAIAVDGGHSPRLGTLGGMSPQVGATGMHDSLLSPSNYAGRGHSRSRSIGHSPMMGTHALDSEMAANAARLGILPSGLGPDGLAHGLGGGQGLDERAAAYARAGVSPRFGPVDGGYPGSHSPYGRGLGLDDGDLGLDGLGGGYSRSRRGSLGGGDDFMLGEGGLDAAYGDDLLFERGRRDSLPFSY